MDRFIARENIKHFRDRLWSEGDADARARLQKLLVAEEDKLGADLELLADIQQHIGDSHQRIERQQALVASMKHDGHDGLPAAQALLDILVESQLLHVKYRQLVLTKISQDRF